MPRCKSNAGLKQQGRQLVHFDSVQRNVNQFQPLQLHPYFDLRLGYKVKVTVQL